MTVDVQDVWVHVRDQLGVDMRFAPGLWQEERLRILFVSVGPSAGFRKQLIVDGVIKNGSVGMHFVGDGDLEDAEAARQVACVFRIRNQCAKYWDDLIKQHFR